MHAEQTKTIPSITYAFEPIETFDNLNQVKFDEHVCAAISKDCAVIGKSGVFNKGR